MIKFYGSCFSPSFQQANPNFLFAVEATGFLTALMSATAAFAKQPFTRRGNNNNADYAKAVKK